MADVLKMFRAVILGFGGGVLGGLFVLVCFGFFSH